MRTIPKKLTGPVIAGILAAALAACAPAPVRNQIVTTLYPTEFLVQRVADGTPPVHNLAAAGVEPHDLELSTRQVDALQDADMVFTLIPGFQPAVDAAVRQRRGTTVELVRALPADVAAAAKTDPHVWLDPVLMRDLARATTDALVAAYPDRADAYRARAAELDAQLVALDAGYRTGLADCQRRTIFTAHDAFGWLAQRYGLTQMSVAGKDPETEPDAATLADLADQARRSGATTIFTEELVSPKVAESLAREAGGLQVATLSPIESLTPEQGESGDDYFSLMRANLATLRAALSCS